MRKELKDRMRQLVSKEAYVPPMDPNMAGAPPGGMPMDPAMAGGAPPMDPMMAQGAPPPPMDPAMAGGPPMDPAMAGGPPMDPAMAGMPPGQEDPVMMLVELLTDMNDKLDTVISHIQGEGGKSAEEIVEEGLSEPALEVQDEEAPGALSAQAAAMPPPGPPVA